MAYDELDRITRYAEGSFATAYDYLSMGMLGSSTTSYGSLQVTGSYAYDIASDEALTGRVSGFTSTVKYGSTTKSNTTYTYTYDAAGNITAIRLGGVLKYSYEYDNLSQLIRENNAVAGETYVFTYDNAGNILTKKTYAYTTGTLGTVQDTDTYTYGNSINGDRLMRYNNVSCVIDALGNPLRYANGTNYIMTWTKGRQLAKTVNGGVTTTYTYNADGIRTSKTVGGVTTSYALDGTTILAEQKDGVVIRYFYDANGSPVGFMYNGTRYHYEKNLQGDIVAILNHAGTALVTYAYDAWGNIVSTTYSASYEYLATANPFRYRGYYYDTETGFYYLQSRYYDPVTCRFINADSYINANGDLVGYNMYAYCSNNPVMGIDPSGEIGWFIKALINITVNVAITYVSAKITGQEYDWSDLTLAVVSGIADTVTGKAKNASAIIDGVSAGISSYQDGASLGTAFLCGAMTTTASLLSIDNLAESLLGVELSFAAQTAVKMTFGFGSELMTTGINMVITKNTQRQSADEQQEESISEVENDPLKVYA